jgi:predicted ATP-grasp superfamily ATP-dependent carboligase
MTSTCCWTEGSDLTALALRLLQPLGWHGPAEVEFKIDERDGRPKLMEVNTRFWGSIGLSIRAGLDIPCMACRLALGEHVEPVTEYAVGLRYRWFIPYSPLSFLRSATSRSLKSPLPRRRTLCELEANDPLPHLTRLLRLARLCYWIPSRTRPLRESRGTPPGIPGRRSASPRPSLNARRPGSAIRG